MEVRNITVTNKMNTLHVARHKGLGNINFIYHQHSMDICFITFKTPQELTCSEYGRGNHEIPRLSIWTLI